MNTPFFKFTFVILSILISSCSSLQRDQNLSYQCQKIILPADPELPIKKLSSTSKPSEVMKAYVASLAYLNEWKNSVQTQIQESY